MTTKQSKQFPTKSSLQTFLREPTLHFFLLAAIIFGLYAITQGRNENLLEINQSEINARIFLEEISNGIELNEEQRQSVAAFYIQEQILVREARAMDLDNDERINDILAQKMRHVLSGNIIQPTTDELAAYYQQNRQRYTSQATVTADELVFNSSGDLASEVTVLLEQGAEPPQLLELEPGNVSSLPNVNSIDLTNIFEADFSQRVFSSELNRWLGPFISNRGQHWLRVIEKTESRIPALEEIADQVRLEWLGEEEESRLQDEVDKLWEQYTIIIVDDEEA